MVEGLTGGDVGEGHAGGDVGEGHAGGDMGDNGSEGHAGTDVSKGTGGDFVERCNVWEKGDLGTGRDMSEGRSWRGRGMMDEHG